MPLRLSGVEVAMREGVGESFFPTLIVSSKRLFQLSQSGHLPTHLGLCAEQFLQM